MKVNIIDSFPTKSYKRDWLIIVDNEDIGDNLTNCGIVEWTPEVEFLEKDLV